MYKPISSVYLYTLLCAGYIIYSDCLSYNSQRRKNFDSNTEKMKENCINVPQEIAGNIFFLHCPNEQKEINENAF